MRSTLYAAFAILFFVGIVFAHQAVYFGDYCYPTFDLGIYMEAVQKFSWTNLNPFLSSFGVGFLNDHWHPALLLAKMMAFVLPLSTSLFLTEIGFTIALALVPFWLVRKNRLDASTAALLSMYLLLNQRQIEATMAFPVHPAVWANALLLFAVALIVSKQKEVFVFGALVVAGFFGEQFSLALLGYSLISFFVSLSSGSLRSKIWRLFAVLLSAVWVWFSLSGRAIFVGPILHQTDRVASDFSSLVSKYDWNWAQAKNVLKFILEAAPLLFVAIRFRKRSTFDKRKFLLIGGIFAPLILGRVLSGSFGHQYDTLWLCAVAAFAMAFMTREVRISNRVLTVSLVLFLVLSYSKFERAYGVLTQSKLQNCVRVDKGQDVRLINAERVKNLNAAVHQIVIASEAGDLQSDRSLRILALGNLVPNLVQALPRAEVMSLGSQPLETTGSSVGWILIEHGACGDPWPWDEAKVENYLEALERDPQVKVLVNTPCLFFAGI